MEEKKDYSLDELLELYYMLDPNNTRLVNFVNQILESEYELYDWYNILGISMNDVDNIMMDDEQHELYQLKIKIFRIRQDLILYLHTRVNTDDEFNVNVYIVCLELGEYDEALSYLRRFRLINEETIQLMLDRGINLNDIWGVSWYTFNLNDLEILLQHGLDPVNVVMSMITRYYSDFRDRFEDHVNNFIRLFLLLEQYDLDWFTIINYRDETKSLIHYLILIINEKMKENFRTKTEYYRKQYENILFYLLAIIEKVKDPYVNPTMMELDIPQDIVNIIRQFRYLRFEDESKDENKD